MSAVVPAERRFAERAAANRRRARRRLGLGALVLLLAGALVWLVIASPVLALAADRITVKGAGGVIDGERVRAAILPEVGTPLVRLDTGVLRARVAALPGVRTAEVRRAWPSGVEVEVAPRVAVVAVPVEGGYVYLDIDGVQVGGTVQKPGKLPVVTVPLTAHNERILAAALSVVDHLPPDLAKLVDTVSATSQDTVTLGLSNGRTVVWGSASDPDLKASVVKALLKKRNNTIDVSAPTMPLTS